VKENYQNTKKHLSSEKQLKIRMRTTRWNFPTRSNILKKKYQQQTKQSKRRFSQKQDCLVPQKFKGASNLYEGYPWASKTRPELNFNKP
jgi:hypothetical protein